VTEIERLQPYHRPDPKFRAALGVLRDLSNIDKHRHIVVTLAAATASGIRLEHPAINPGTYVTGYSGPLKKGTVIARWKFIGAPPAAEAEVRVQADMGVNIAFADGWPAYRGDVIGFLDGLIAYTRDTIFPPLEALLK
jgi:hypothetical protein